MIYVMSDIHGDLAKFNKMLKLINFSKDDHLYVLGDMVDRGDYPITVLLKCLSTENITPLLGNHEQMMIEYIDDSREDNWLHNGGNITYDQFYGMEPSSRQELERRIRALLTHITIDVGERKFVLVHAGVMTSLDGDVWETQNKEFMVWARSEFYSHTYVNENQTVIFGHTPTKKLHGKHVIWRGVNKICIDCGAVYGGKLACLRLNDMEEFYVG